MRGQVIVLFVESVSVPVDLMTRRKPVPFAKPIFLLTMSKYQTRSRAMQCASETTKTAFAAKRRAMGRRCTCCGRQVGGGSACLSKAELRGLRKLQVERFPAAPPAGVSRWLRASSQKPTARICKECSPLRTMHSQLRTFSMRWAGALVLAARRLYGDTKELRRKGLEQCVKAAKTRGFVQALHGAAHPAWDRTSLVLYARARDRFLVISPTCFV